MKHKRTTAMLVCGLAVIGAIAAIPATSASAYTCLGNPSGDNTGNSNPEAGEYDDNDCPYTEAQLEEQWRNLHEGYQQDSPDATPVDAPDYSITPYTDTISVPPLGDNGRLNPLDTESSYLSSDLFASAVAPGASEAATAAASVAAAAVAGGISLPWDKMAISEAAPKVDGEIYQGVPAFPYPQRSTGSTADEDGRRSDQSGVDKNVVPKGLKVISNKNVGKDLGAGNNKFTFSWTLGNGVTLTQGVKDGMFGLEKFATVTPVMSSIVSDLVVGYTISFNTWDLGFAMPSDDAQLARAVFALSNNNVSQCTGKNGTFVCDLDKGYTISTNTAKLGVNTDSDRTLPICAGGVVDAGPGLASSFSLDQAGCEASPDKKPVRLVIDHTYADTSFGIPLVSADGTTIDYTATSAASSQFVSSLVWAVSDDGTYSMPFNVIFRVRNAPIVAGTPTVSVLRGMESTVSAANWFSDVDRDQFEAQSGDHLAYQVVTDASKGSAWFQGSDLHYMAAGLIKGEYDDQITIKAVDRFGISSGEVTIPIHVSDVVPSCVNGVSTTDARTPTRINPVCFLGAPVGWSQLPGESLTYSIVKQPQFGAVTNFDPQNGTATFTPDRAHPGPDSITLEAHYNSQVRDTVYALNVLTAP
ncbi:hypothetical protein [Subtercola endophyticus]|uniref:hypothetical protein n=1 Tax=Subtercola endophyticus TaxID=2895559 RepID=UPI001E597B1E|nr:hypothetical protein [Subtercola endophyticus]UFS60462.1 hypothetical protein LQ955_06885 [Subtercola endophyticus]